MEITVKQLKALGACEDQVKLFQDLFGPSVVVTEALCVQHAQKFSWGWAAQNFLSAPARKAYDEAAAPAWKAYKKAIARAWKAYQKASAPARKAYQEVTASALKAYDEATARAFGRLAEQED